MGDEGVSAFKHDVSRVSRWFAKGDEKIRKDAGRALRRWRKRGEIAGYQRELNAAVKLSGAGVLDGWERWAAHKGLDAVNDMPAEVRKIADEVGRPATVVDSTNGLTVTVLVPPGITVKVVTTAA